MERRGADLRLVYIIIICYAVSAESGKLLSEGSRLLEFGADSLQTPSSSNNFHEAALGKIVTQNRGKDVIHKLGEGTEMVSGNSAGEWATKVRNNDLNVRFDSNANNNQKFKLEKYAPNRDLAAKDESFIFERKKRQNNLPAGVWGREDTHNSIEEGGLVNRESLAGVREDTENLKPAEIWNREEDKNGPEIPAGVWGREDTHNSIEEGGLVSRKSLDSIILVREDSENNRPPEIWNREEGKNGPELPAGVWGRDVNLKDMAGVWNRAVERAANFKASQEREAIGPGLDSLGHAYTEGKVWDKQARSDQNHRPGDYWGHNSESTSKHNAFGAWARSADLKLVRPARLSRRQLRRSTGKQEGSVDSQPQRPPGLWFGRQLESVVENAKTEASQTEEKMKLPPGILPGKREE